MSKNVRKLTELSVLTAVALIIFVIELQIPNPFPIPGIKLGLANIVTVLGARGVGQRSQDEGSKDTELHDGLKRVTSFCRSRTELLTVRRRRGAVRSTHAGRWCDHRKADFGPVVFEPCLSHRWDQEGSSRGAP